MKKIEEYTREEKEDTLEWARMMKKLCGKSPRAQRSLDMLIAAIEALGVK